MEKINTERYKYMNIYMKTIRQIKCKEMILIEKVNWPVLDCCFNCTANDLLHQTISQMFPSSKKLNNNSHTLN